MNLYGKDGSMTTHRLALLLLCAAAIAAGADERPSAKDGFAKIQDAAAKKDPELLDVLLPSKFVEGRRDSNAEAVKSWREGFALSLASAKLLDAREDGDDALVQLQIGDNVAILPLHFGGSRWVVAAAQAYVTKGKALSRTNGTAPVPVKLGMRTTNSAYGDTAFSFGHVTSDASICKNRMDVWFCHNGDLHGARNATIADVGATTRAAVEWLPAARTLQREAHAVPGHAYVVHCWDDRGDEDFYAKLAVSGVGADSVAFTWQVLALGPGAPPSIKKPNPVDPKDRTGADGCDGLCGKNAPNSGGTTPGSGGKAGK